jgi:opacity protein-like surface antigen
MSASADFHLDLNLDVTSLDIDKMPWAKWLVIVATACTIASVSEPVAFGQLSAPSEPRASERAAANSETPPRVPGMQSEQIVVRPSEGYFAGFGGYTFGGKFDAEGTGVFNGASFGNGSLANSAVVGAKAGGFFPESLNWLGVEAELFNTTPHIEQQGAAAGSHMRVTTLAINAIARAQFACEKKHVDTEQVTERFAFQYVTEFCRLQPYAGVGLGIYWVDISNSSFSAHANFVPGFNALAGVRYYVTDRIAMFTEYKYNRATFDFAGVQGLAGFEGVYSVNHIVGGISYHY